MEIILLEDVDKLGTAGEIVKVKAGFGRNYLIPQRLAVIANKTNRGVVEEKLRIKALNELKRLDEYREIAQKLQDTVIKIGAKTGTSGKIFGSVTNIQLSNAIKETLGIDIDRKKIIIQDEVKMVGTYAADANLHDQVPCKINFEVVAE